MDKLDQNGHLMILWLDWLDLGQGDEINGKQKDN